MTTAVTPASTLHAALTPCRLSCSNDSGNWIGNDLASPRRIPINEPRNPGTRLLFSSVSKWKPENDSRYNIALWFQKIRNARQLSQLAYELVHKETQQTNIFNSHSHHYIKLQGNKCTKHNKCGMTAFLLGAIVSIYSIRIPFFSNKG
jgi:hypothetical protein